MFTFFLWLMGMGVVICVLEIDISAGNGRTRISVVHSMGMQIYIKSKRGNKVLREEQRSAESDSLREHVTNGQTNFEYDMK